MWFEKNPWTTLVSLCLSIGQYRFFSLCIGLQRFGSSGSKVATFPYKCSMRSTLCQLPAPAGNGNFQYKCSTQSTFWQLQLESSNFSVVCAGHFGSSGSKVAAFQCKQVQYGVVYEVHFGSSTAAVATFQYKCSTQSTCWQLQRRLQGSWLDSAWRPMSWVSVGYRFGYRFGPCKFMIPQSWFATTTRT